jgi:hypothetical protein
MTTEAENSLPVSDVSPLGPILTGTLVARDLRATVRAYCEYLSARVFEDTVVSETQAMLWGKPKLAGTPVVTLCSPSGYPWVRVISNPEVVAARPFMELGWMALEVLVQDVDALSARLEDSPFSIYRQPSDKDASGDSRSMQVIGPAGEVLYLTQVNAHTAPLDVPRARCDVDRLFTSVSSCLRRDAALKVYAKLGAGSSACFDIPIASVNRAHGLDPELRHAAATVQLAGCSTVEVNQLGVATARPPSPGSFPAGIAIVTILIDSITDIGLFPISPVSNPPGRLYGGQPVAACRGSSGELIELIQAAP